MYNLNTYIYTYTHRGTHTNTCIYVKVIFIKYDENSISFNMKLNLTS